MSKPFKPRKKRLQVIPKENTMKSVRIDEKTVIMVNLAITDEEARIRYLQRHTPPQPYPLRVYPLTEKECYKEVPIGTVEHLAQIIDDTELPETE